MKSWTLHTCGDVVETAEYTLKPLGKKRTRLDISFVVSYDSKGDVEDKDDWEAVAANNWKAYKKALEADFSSGKPPS